LNVSICIMAVLAGVFSAPALNTPPTTTLPPLRTSNVIVGADGNVENFYGVPLSVTVSSAKSLPYPVKIGQERIEDEPVTVATLKAIGDVEVKLVFEDSGELYSAETRSPNAVGPRGIGIGSLLSEVKKAWPKGRFGYGSEDGWFVTFSTATNLYYRFDPAELPPEAFDHSGKDVVVPDLRVKKLQVYRRR
jgi:hypothetical protein